ncbi:MAG TPA: undecaprenyl-diphosphate phosphatase [Gemmatimonadales bacterium]|nr:undecaprenyl-diphosphate phosphatase [Gemmatimonadales bacterium]
MDVGAAWELHPLAKAAILGLVEGATEFIPVSSTGHLIIAGNWLDFEGQRASVFEVFIQLGAILAIVWLYRARLARLLSSLASDPGSRRLVWGIGLAFLPAAVVGLVAHDAIKRYLFNPVSVAAALVAGGLAMLAIEWRRPKPRIHSVDDVPPATALGIGLAQVLSLIPGVSRSGATIMGGYCLGLSRAAATEFSFFLAIPVMFAASGYDLLKNLSLLSAADVPVFATGFVVSFASALVGVRLFVGFVSRSTFVPFAVYRIAFGITLLLWYRQRVA